MAYTDPTFDEFTTAFPEFEDVDDELFNIALLAAKQGIDTSWFEADYTRALMLATAHTLSQSELTGEAGASIASESLGPISLTYRSTTDGESSTYNTELDSIRRRNKPTILVV